MTTLQKRSAVEEICVGIADFFQIQEFKTIVEFVEQDVDLSEDVSAAKDKVDFVHAPHLLEPLKACTIEEGVRKRVVCCWIDQSGKSLLETLALLYNLCYNSMQSLLVFPSLDLAVESTQTKLIPLLRKVPQLKADLDKPFAIRSDRIKLSNGLAYVQGAGVKIVSRSCKMVLADETAIWQSPPGVDNVKELQKRTRSYNECLEILVSTPSFKENSFWQAFLDGSQGYWTLRCRSCGGLTMRSCDTNNLQFETTYDEITKAYVPVHGSCRLVCPKCGHEHTEEDRNWCIEHGDYVHTYPDRVATRPSFQFGALGSELTVHRWDSLAEVILRSGSTAELSDYVSLDNSYKGLPYQEREYRAQGDAALSRLEYKDPPPAEDVEAVLLAADTQDAFSVVGRLALMRDGTLYLLDISRPRYLWLADDERKVIDAENRREGRPPERTVLDLLDEEVLGVRPMMLLVDRQGHRQDEVSNFARMRRNIVLYSGTALKYDNFKPSESIHKLFLFNEKTFRAELVFKLYFDKGRMLRLPAGLSEQDREEIVCVQADKTKRNGALYENWIPLHDEVHDAFDTIKMGLCAVKLAALLYRGKFRHNEAKCLNPQGVHREEKRQRPRPSAPRRGVFG